MLIACQTNLSCSRLNTSSALKDGSCSKKLVKNIAYREIPCALMDPYPHTIEVLDPDPHSKRRSRSRSGVQNPLQSLFNFLSWTRTKGCYLYLVLKDCFIHFQRSFLIVRHCPMACNNVHKMVSREANTELFPCPRSKCLLSRPVSYLARQQPKPIHISRQKYLSVPMLQIREVLIRIRIRRTLPLDFGSGSCSFLGGFQDVTKKKFFRLSLNLGIFKSVFKETSY